MELKYRRIYAYSVIAIFVIIAPILILYTKGYRYDFKKNQIVKTGVLNIDSNPRDASIVLNGKLVKKKTQAVVKNLPPQEYQIAIEKDGYYAWEKELPVFPNQATLTNRITLFKKNTPALLSEENVSQFKVSPDYSLIAYLAKNEKERLVLVVKRLSDSHEIARLPLAKAAGYSISFSENQNYLFLHNKQDDKNEYQIVFLKSNQLPLPLSEISNLDFSKIKAPIENNIIYGLSNGKLYEMDLSRNSSRLLIDDSIQDFTVTSKNLYYIHHANEKCLAKKANLNGKFEIQELLTVACKENYFLDNGPNNFLTFLDNNHHLFLIEIQGELSLNLKQLDQNVMGFNWSADQKKLLLYNEFEIWVLDTETEEQELLIRSSEKIENAVWNYDSEWIVLYQSGTIKAIELDGRDKRNIIDLVSCPNSNFAIDFKQARIILNGISDDPARLYQLELR
ncbi:MAG: hypothetical protein COY66_00185 [Candidatus Kerfeldbacteria bacterium CG_4_10_14_0_8_um_filter_42_10]|uniref:PEGA domain-containing protein n=1 Tax=Candidatus Kerfeldbacteria bacterium CG_4_10_14_0_8_um_filter_42_10 TaxID=2014248 RepID=A0A2M7RL40_9BACT|nr:MAG: hypothetical protein COY66_00185 [Candidatus Kerfeldbacteria bacterium CG_4_10_14_0_8_um_filter_42_10]